MGFISSISSKRNEECGMPKTMHYIRDILLSAGCIAKAASRSAGSAPVKLLFVRSLKVVACVKTLWKGNEDATHTRLRSR